MTLDQIGEFWQQALAFIRLGLAPGAFERPPGRRDRAVDIVASPSATLASSSPVAGLRVSKRLPEAASHHLPSISICL
jgi:hypothetical protein